MANSKAFKRLVRQRMALTGESYMAAMHAIRNGGSPTPRVVKPPPPGQPPRQGP